MSKGKWLGIGFGLTFILMLTARVHGAQVVAWGASDEVDVPPDATNIVAIAGGGANLAVREDGTVIAWGDDRFFPPNVITNATQVAAGSVTYLALKNDGTIVAWGWNLDGSTVVPAGLAHVAKIAMGGSHALALTEDGTVVTWGVPIDGSLDVPADLGKSIAIGAGPQHSLAVRADGTVAAWGDNSHGQCDVPADLHDVIAVAGGGWQSVALKNDGTVVVWGGDPTVMTPPAGLSNVVAIAAGNFHNVALKRDGTVVSWGPPGQWLIPPATELRNVVAISAATYHNLALTTVNTPFIVKQPVGGKFSSGQTFTLDVIARGSGTFQYQWWKDGSPVVGATNSVLTYSNISSLNDGQYKVVVTNPGGTLSSDTVQVHVVDSAFFRVDGVRIPSFDFGAGEPPVGLSDVVQTECSLTHALALRADGTVAGWAFRGGSVLAHGADVPPAGLNNVIDIACGDGFSLALKRDGSIVSWGQVPLTQPPDPAVLSDFVDVAASADSGFGLRANGAVVSFGGALFTPGETDIKAIVASQSAFSPPNPPSAILHGLRQDGTVWRWTEGGDAFGVNEGLVNVAQFDAADGNLVAILTDGTVSATRGTTNVSGAKAVSAGPVDGPYIDVAFAVALKNDGTVASWRGGPDTRGLTNVTLISVRNNYALVQTLWPAIVREPVDAVLNVGSEATFSVDMRGVGPFRFQWRKDGADLPGETNLSLRISQAKLTDAGKYSVMTFNKNGRMLSSEAELSLQPLQILTQPASEISFVGGKVGFSVAATGSEPMSYQWRKGTNVLTDIPGATNSFFAIAPLQASDAGVYSVAITSPAGTTNSGMATLQIFPAPTWKTGSPGTVVAFDGPPAPADLTNAIAVASGAEYGLALLADGTVRQWGTNSTTMKWPPPAGLSNVVSIAADRDIFGAVRRDGTVAIWGNYPVVNVYGVVGLSIENQLTVIKVDGSWGYYGVDVPPGTSPAVDVQLQSHSVALMRDGRVVTWNDLDGVTSYIPDITNAVQIAADNYSYMVLLSDGTVYGRYFGTRRVPDADLTDLTAIALGEPDYGLGLKRDGTVIGWGTANVPTNLTNVTAINAGGFGVVIKQTSSAPKLQIRDDDVGQGILHADFLPQGFILESSQTVNTGYAPAPAGVTLDAPIPLSKPHEFFRLRKPQ